jgi:hypothetical protein
MNLKLNKMKDMIEKQKQDQEKELAELKAKKEEENQKTKESLTENLLVAHADDKEEIDIDDI